MTDFLDEKRDEIDDRLAELRPLVEEYNRLLAASAALRGVDGSSGMGMGMGVVVGVPSSEPIDVSGGLSGEAASVETVSEAASAPVASSDSVSVSDSDSGSAPALAPVRRGPGRPRGSGAGKSHQGNDESVSSSDGDDGAADLTPSSASGAPRRAGRPKGSGTRAAEALRIVREHPGVTIPELADRMGIKQNYLYRVLPELVQEGKVAKQGRGWHPRAA